MRFCHFQNPETRLALYKRLDATKDQFVLMGCHLYRLLGVIVIVIVMLRPGTEIFKMGALLPIIAALAYACMLIITSKLGMQDKAGTMTFYIQFAFIVISSIIGLSVGDDRFYTPDNPTLGFLLRS